MRIQLTIRTLLAATAVVGVFFAGRLLLKQMLEVNPNSLSVEVESGSVSPPWENCDWTPVHSGVYISLESPVQFTPLSPSEDPFELRQLLLSVEYRNGLGISDFAGFIQLDMRDNVLRLPRDLTVGGAGGHDAAVICRPSFDVPTKILRLDLTTYVNSKRIAKRCTLEFVFDGERFVPKSELE